MQLFLGEKMQGQSYSLHHAVVHGAHLSTELLHFSASMFACRTPPEGARGLHKLSRRLGLALCAEANITTGEDLQNITRH